MITISRKVYYDNNEEYIVKTNIINWKVTLSVCKVFTTKPLSPFADLRYRNRLDFKEGHWALFAVKTHIQAGRAASKS